MDKVIRIAFKLCLPYTKGKQTEKPQTTFKMCPELLHTSQSPSPSTPFSREKYLTLDVKALSIHA